MARVVLLLGSLGALVHLSSGQRRVKTWRDTAPSTNRWETPARNQKLPTQVDTESSNTDERFFSDFGWDDPNFSDLPDVLPGWGFSESQKVPKRQPVIKLVTEDNSRTRATQQANSRTRGENIRIRGQSKDNSRTRTSPKDNSRNRGQLKAHTRTRGQLEDTVRTRSQLGDNTRTRIQLGDNSRSRSQPENNIRTTSQLDGNTRTRNQLEDNTRTRNQIEDNARTRNQLEDNTRIRIQVEDNIRTRGQAEDNVRTRNQLEDNIRIRGQAEDNVRTRNQLEDNIRIRGQAEDNIRTRSQQLLKENTRTQLKNLRAREEVSGMNDNSRIVDESHGNTERHTENALNGKRQQQAYERRTSPTRQTNRRPDKLDGNVRRIRKKQKPREPIMNLNPEQHSEISKNPRVITESDRELISYFSKKPTVAKTRTSPFSEDDGFLPQLSKSVGPDAGNQGTQSFANEFLPREQTTLYNAKYSDISQSTDGKNRKPSFTDDFLPALDLDIIKPVNSANNVPGYSEIVPFEIDTESSESSEDDHPGSFSFGIFGEHEQSTQNINKKKEEINSFFNDKKFFISENIGNISPKVTTYRPTFLFPGLDTTVGLAKQNPVPPQQNLALPKQNLSRVKPNISEKIAQPKQNPDKNPTWSNKNIQWKEHLDEEPREIQIKDTVSGSRDGNRNGFMPLETTMYTGLYDKLKEHGQSNKPENKKTYFKPTFFEKPKYPLDDTIDTHVSTPIEKLSSDDNNRRIRHFKNNDDKKIDKHYFDEIETVTKPTTVSSFFPTVISFSSSLSQKEEIAKLVPTTERITERTRQAYLPPTIKKSYQAKPKTRFVPTTLPPVLTTPLTNIMNENKYAQTIVRNLKTRPVKTFTSSKPVSEKKEQPDRNIKMKNTNLQKENNYGATNVRALKTIPRKKPSEMRLKDILKEVPQRRLNKILKSAGLKVTNLLRNEPEALEVVHNAMRGKETRNFEQKIKFEPEEIESEETNTEDKTTSSQHKRKTSGEWDSVKVSSDIKEEFDIDVEKMDIKTLMKTISPMSISEVLQKVGFSLKDIMRGNKNAIKAVLKFHQEQTKPQEDKVEATYKSTTYNSKTTKRFTKSTTTTIYTTTTTTKKPTKPSGRKSIDLFKKFAKNFKYSGRTTRTTPRTTPTTETTTSTHEVSSTTLQHRLRFGQKTTTNKRFPSSSTFRIDTTNSEYDRIDATNTEYDRIDIVDTEKIVTEKTRKTLSQNEETSTSMKVLKEDLTTQYITDTLKNLNMTVEDLEGKKNDKLETIMTLFGDFSDKKGTPKNTEIIYGDKEIKATPKKYKKYIATDIGGNGGVRGVGYNPFNNRRGGEIITNRKTTTTTTTREPYTYLSYNDYTNEQSFDKQDDLELPNSIDYFYDDPYEDYNVYEVPTGVKSALIASSVVGGLAVSIFLFIFMLCLWKQMKNKLRMATQYEEGSKPGIFTNILSKTASKNAKNKNKNETTGYFNKVPATASGNQQYSSSSEEY